MKQVSVLFFSLMMITMSLSGCIEELSHAHDDGTSHVHPGGDAEHDHILIDSTVDDTPRISMWPGKVNQHNENGTWMTDPDGKSGGHLSTDYPNDYGDRKLEYCQKFWPDAVDVKLRPDRETITFYTAGNANAYNSTKDVYECVFNDDSEAISTEIGSMIMPFGEEVGEISTLWIIIFTSIVWLLIIAVLQFNRSDITRDTTFYREDEQFKDQSNFSFEEE